MKARKILSIVLSLSILAGLALTLPILTTASDGGSWEVDWEPTIDSTTTMAGSSGWLSGATTPIPGGVRVSDGWGIVSNSGSSGGISTAGLSDGEIRFYQDGSSRALGIEGSGTAGGRNDINGFTAQPGIQYKLTFDVITATDSTGRADANVTGFSVRFNDATSGTGRQNTTSVSTDASNPTKVSFEFSYESTVTPIAQIIRIIPDSVGLLVFTNFKIEKYVLSSPTITSITATPATLTSAGGSSVIAIAGAALEDEVEIGVFNAAGTQVGTNYTATQGANINSQSVSITFDANTSTTTDAVYTIKASLDGTTFLSTPTATVTVSADFVEGKTRLMYDMQKDPALTANGNGGLVTNSSGTRALTTVDGQKRITVTGRTGTSQGIRLSVPALNEMTKDGHTYRIEYSGILSSYAAGERGRIRLENGNNTVGTAVGLPAYGNLDTDGAFTVSFSLTKAQIAGLITGGTTQLSLGNADGANVVVAVTGIKVFSTCPASCTDAYPNFEWDINPDDITVNRIGSIGGALSIKVAGHVLKLSDLSFDPNNLPTKGATLDIPFAVAHNSTRRVVVWSDLSGNTPDIEDYTFATPANLAAGDTAVVRLASGATSASVNVPQKILYDEVANKYATTLYVILTTDNDNTHTADNQRGGDSRNNVNGVNLTNEFNIFRSITLNVIPQDEVASYVTLTPGKNETEMNFAWMASVGTGNTIFEIIEASQLVNDRDMPDTPAHSSYKSVTVTGTPAAYNLLSYKTIITGLSLDTEYAYRIGNVGGEWGKIYRFKTYDPDDGYNVILVSDPQLATGSSRPANWRTSFARALTKAEDDFGGASFMLSAGDTTGYANDMEEWDAFFAPPGLKNMPYFTTVGNHDTNDFLRAGAGREDVSMQPFFFNLPNHNALGGSPFGTATNEARQNSGGGDSWFRYGNTLYLSINANFMTFNAARIAFLENAVSDNDDATWIIAVFHQDIYGGGNGHSTGMGGRRTVLVPILEDLGVDVVITGHDHTHTRSQFMSGEGMSAANDVGTIKKYQMPNKLDADEKGIFEPHAREATYISPSGIIYLTLGSPADFPKYSSVIPPHVWVAYTDPAAHDALAQYSIMSIDGNDLEIKTYVIETTGERMHDSIKLSKEAKTADLTSLLTGMNAVVQNGVSDSTWSAFQSAITAASGATAATAHDLYVALYDAYYALDPETDKVALDALINQVLGTLSTATEGLWAGQYPRGSIATLREVLNRAIDVNDVRLSTQTQIDTIKGELDTAYIYFLSLVSDTPRPWTDIHNIPSSGVYTMGLLDWMEDSLMFNTHWEGDGYIVRDYFAHHTKNHFAAGFIEGAYLFTENGGYGGPRTEPVYGPANGAGGRASYGGIPGHITKTHAGEWIRYELNVAQAGGYELKLGAINNNSSAMEIRVRDTAYNDLTKFIVPAGHGTGGWASSPMITAENLVYLPEGKYIIELLFINDGVGASGSGSGAIINYNADGADLDILTLERIGDMSAPNFKTPSNVYVLPLPPNIAAGQTRRQQGWGTENRATGENGTPTHSPVPIDMFSQATHLVFEYAARPAAIPTMVLMSDLDGWKQTDAANVIGHFDDINNTLTIDLTMLDGYELWSMATVSKGLIVTNNNTDGWNGLYVIKAYLRMGDDVGPEDPEDDPEDSGIRIVTQPQSIIVTEGSINQSLSVVAQIVGDTSVNDSLFADPGESGSDSASGSTDDEGPTVLGITDIEGQFFADLSEDPWWVSISGDSSPMSEGVTNFTATWDTSMANYTSGSFSFEFPLSEAFTYGPLQPQFVRGDTITVEYEYSVNGGTTQNGSYTFRYNPAPEWYTLFPNRWTPGVINLGSSWAAGEISFDFEITSISYNFTNLGKYPAGGGEKEEEVGELSYQWYMTSSSASRDDASPVGDDSPTFNIPTELTVGSYYYFVTVSASGLDSVISAIATVSVISGSPGRSQEDNNPSPMPIRSGRNRGAEPAENKIESGLSDVIVDIPIDAIQEIAGTLPVFQLSVGTPGRQIIRAGARLAGQNAILLRYNETTGQFEIVTSSTVGANGEAGLNVTRAGDYIVIIRQTGDITGSGRVESTDALELLKALTGEIELDPLQKYVASSRRDGTITAADALAILKFVVGITDSI